ncbi:zinc ABC transporter substrate-binding protein [Aliiroseovarius marinus]|uniref:zinc ABC transporter substrate-binding protein n=1 Tax=Aliiroseovarius marinus TaxID=2500159 RepID=UPI003D7E64A5
MFKTLLAAASLAPIAAFSETPKVITDIAPVHALVTQVMAGVGEPVLLMPQGDNPHNFQLRPSQMGAIQDADLFVWIGPELMPALERARNAADGLTALSLLHVPGLETLTTDHVHDHDHDHDHAEHDDHNDDHDEHNHDDHEHETSHDDDHSEHADHKDSDHGHDEEAHKDHDHDSHDHDEHEEDHGTAQGEAKRLDPHVWLSPASAMVWLDAIADELSKIDPDNAALYHENAHKAEESYATLDAKIDALLEPVHEKGFIVAHDAYRYFNNRYDLNQKGTLSESDAASPSAARLAEIEELTRSGEITCVFMEPGHYEGLMSEFSKSDGVRVGMLDPTGQDIPIGADMLAGLLWMHANAVHDCLSGK